ncbi:MAG: hypothetical protein QXQ14_01910 [Candidatus Aenigmatarchaeota archaeon]
MENKIEFYVNKLYELDKKFQEKFGESYKATEIVFSSLESLDNFFLNFSLFVDFIDYMFSKGEIKSEEDIKSLCYVARGTKLIQSLIEKYLKGLEIKVKEELKNAVRSYLFSRGYFFEIDIISVFSVGLVGIYLNEVKGNWKNIRKKEYRIQVISDIVFRTLLYIFRDLKRDKLKILKIKELVRKYLENQVDLCSNYIKS